MSSDNGPVAQLWRRPSPHGESLRAMAKPSPWRDFYDGDIAPRRHPSPYGDTFPDLATGVAKARQPRELDHILHSVSTGTYAIQEMAGWRNKKGKSGSVATLSSSKMAERAVIDGPFISNDACLKKDFFKGV